MVIKAVMTGSCTRARCCCARQILTCLACCLQEKGMDWEGFFERLKKNGQWHVEVY